MKKHITKKHHKKKWTTALNAASKTYKKTHSFAAAKKSLKKQALFNARKLFGTI